jgi:hypothetical protein
MIRIVYRLAWQYRFSEEITREREPNLSLKLRVIMMVCKIVRESLAQKKLVREALEKGSNLRIALGCSWSVRKLKFGLCPMMLDGVLG